MIVGPLPHRAWRAPAVVGTVARFSRRNPLGALGGLCVLAMLVMALGVLNGDNVGPVTLFRVYPHTILYPGILLALTILSVNLLGDGLRDTLDPRMRRRL